MTTEAQEGTMETIRHMDIEIPAGATWHVPPEHRGQIVTYSYACDETGVWMREEDASDGSQRWWMCPWDVACGYDMEDMHHTPPEIPDDLWTMVREDRRTR